MRHRAMLQTVGARVRALRDERSLSRRELSRLSGVSERFLAQLEGGQGNISLSRLADVCDALGTTPGAILAGASTGGQHDIVALLGVRGAGKSSVGAELARRRNVDFVEIDALIERAAGLSLGEIFELHGESYYRRMEREVLGTLLSDSRPAIIATGGSIVNHRENFAMLQGSACTVWLKARPQDHWNRVIEQGDERPMAENPHAYSELKALLAARERLYASSNFVVDTAEKSIEEVVDAVAQAVGETVAGIVPVDDAGSADVGNADVGGADVGSAAVASAAVASAAVASAAVASADTGAPRQATEERPAPLHPELQRRASRPR